MNDIDILTLIDSHIALFQFVYLTDIIILRIELTL
jgi:hypothetical protein